MQAIKKTYRSFHARKLFRYFAALFVVPFVLITLLILNNLFTSFSQQAMKEQLSSTSRALEHLQIWTDAFRRIVAQLVGDDSLDPNSLSAFSGQSALQTKLRLLTASHSGLEYIWYKLPEEDRFLSGDDSLSIDRLNANRFTVPEDLASGKTLYDTLLAGEVVVSHDRYRGRDCLLFPYFFTLNAKRTMLVFELCVENIRSDLQGLWGNSRGMVRLRSSSGRTLLYLPDGYEGAFTAAATCPQGMSEPFATLAQYQGSLPNGQLIISTSAAARDWAIDLVCINNLVSRFRVMQSVALLLMAVFLLGCCVCIVLTVRLYKPIRSIRACISGASSLPDEAYEDDYDYIESSIELINSDNRQLRTALHAHTEKAREFVSSMLFSGHIKSLEEFQSVYGFCGYVPTKSPYRILALDTSLEPARRLLGTLRAADRIRLALSTGVHCTVFCDSEPLSDLSRLPQGAGLSLPSTELAQAPLLCAQAWFSLSMQQPVFSPDLCALALSAAPACEEAFRIACERGDVSGLLTPAETLELSDLSAYTRALAACLLQHIEVREDVTLDDPSVFHIPSSASASELESDLLALAALLASLIQPDEREEEDLLGQMYHYIAKQFDAPNFSIKQMACDFSMSISALSSYFKSHAGVLLSDYITEMKIKKAMQLLEFSNLSIQEVGLSIGYFNVNSFARRFHQMTNMTPREYRSLHAAPKSG